MGTENLKHELLEILESIDKEELNLCDLKEYAEIVKVVSEIKGRDYMEIVASMISEPSMGNVKALGSPISIREMRNKRHDKEEDDD